MRADHAQQRDRCNVTKDDVFQTWLQEREIRDVEACVPDMAGSARLPDLVAGTRNPRC